MTTDPSALQINHTSSHTVSPEKGYLPGFFRPEQKTKPIMKESIEAKFANNESQLCNENRNNSYVGTGRGLESVKQNVSRALTKMKALRFIRRRKSGVVPGGGGTKRGRPSARRGKKGVEFRNDDTLSQPIRFFHKGAAGKAYRRMDCISFETHESSLSPLSTQDPAPPPGSGTTGGDAPARRQIFDRSDRRTRSAGGGRPVERTAPPGTENGATVGTEDGPDGGVAEHRLANEAQGEDAVEGSVCGLGGVYGSFVSMVKYSKCAECAPPEKPLVPLAQYKTRRELREQFKGRPLRQKASESKAGEILCRE